MKKAMNLNQAAFLGFTLVFVRCSVLLPRLGASAGGRAGWLLPLFVSLPALALTPLFARLFSGKRQADLPAALRERLPEGVFRALGLLTALLALAGAALTLCQTREGLHTILFFNSGSWPLLLGLLAAAAFIASEPPVVLARVHGVAALGILGGVALCFALLVPEGRVSHVLPLRGAALPPLFAAGLSISGCWVYFLLPFALGEGVDVGPHPAGTLRRFLAAELVALLLLCLLPLAELGPELAAKLPYPFLYSLRDSHQSFLQKGEIFIFSLWILGGGLRLAALLRLAGNALSSFLRRPLPARAIWLLALGILPPASLLPRNTADLDALSLRVFLPVLSLFLPLLAALPGVFSAKMERRRRSAREKGRRRRLMNTED